MILLNFFHSIKENWKGILLLTCTILMPFLDDHKEKILTAFMALITYEISRKKYSNKKQ